MFTLPMNIGALRFLMVSVAAPKLNKPQNRYSTVYWHKLQAKQRVSLQQIQDDLSNTLAANPKHIVPVQLWLW